MSDQIVFSELRSAGKLPSPHGVALKIIRLCQRENVSLQELAHTIQSDPALSGRIIMVANFANRNKSRPIASVTTDALILIGIEAVRQVVLGFSLISSNYEFECVNFDFKKFWSRSVAIASIAQKLGSAANLAPPAEIFTLGLLASIGRLCLAVVRPQAYSSIIANEQSSKPSEIIQAETQRFGMNHNQLTAAMMEDWGFPKLFMDAAEFHEAPETSPLSVDSRPYKLACLLHFSELLGDVFTQGLADSIVLSQEMLDSASVLGLSPDAILDNARQAAGDWHDWCHALNVDAYQLGEIELPEALSSEEDGVQSANQSSVRSMRILVADDDDALVFMLNKLLTAASHQVFVARNGLQALELAQKERPEIIIADWVMPEMDGLELCKALHESGQGRDLYFIMLTALENERHRHEAIKAGANEYLQKPLDIKLLNEKLINAASTISQ